MRKGSLCALYILKPRLTHVKLRISLVMDSESSCKCKLRDILTKWRHRAIN